MGGGGGSLVGSVISPRQSGVWTTAAHGTGHSQHFNDMQLMSDSDATYESNADSERTCSTSESVSDCAYVSGGGGGEESVFNCEPGQRFR